MTEERILQRMGKPDITYYVSGSGDEHVLLVSPPGMSIKFWLPLVAELRQHYRVIHADFRGFPESERRFEDSELTMAHLVEDLRAVVEHERVKQVHVVAWCKGTQVAAPFCEQMPKQLLSLSLMNIEPDGRDSFLKTQFGRLVSQVERKIARNPSRVHSMVEALRGYVSDPNGHYMVMAGDEYDPTSLLKELDSQDDLRKRAFHLLTSPENLANFLKINTMVRGSSFGEYVRALKVPVLILQGAQDEVTTMEEHEVRALIGNNPGGRYEEIPQGGHFMLLQCPRPTANALRRHMRDAKSGAIRSSQSNPQPRPSGP